MFNFNKKNADVMADESAETSQMENVVKVPEASTKKETVIAPGSVLRGQITNENNISINGIVEGDIFSQKTTQIGREGEVIGQIKTTSLYINGVLKGGCHAQTVVIMSQGRVEGDIHASEFSIEKGGVFVGNSHHLEEKNLPQKSENSHPKKPSRPLPVQTGKEQDTPRPEK